MAPSPERSESEIELQKLNDEENGLEDAPLLDEDHEVPPLSKEIATQWKIFIPTLSSMLLYKMPWLISLRFVGQLNNTDHLAAAALASTLCNVTGISFAVGLSSALVTLTGQARGDRLATGPKKSPLNLPLLYLYRGLFVCALFVIPIGLIWLYGVGDILQALGQTEELSQNTEKYLRILTIGLWGYSINWTLTAWLQSIEMAEIPAYAASLGLLLHIPFNYLFVYTLGFDYLGCAIATVLFQVIQPILISSYVFLSSRGRARLMNALAADNISFKPEVERAIYSFAGLKEYLSLALPGIVLISEWWASEVSIFLSGKLEPNPSVALGGMTLYQSINTSCFMFPVACSVAGSTRVSNLLGANRPFEAHRASLVSIVAAAIVSALCMVTLFLLPHTLFPSFFTDEVGLVEQTATVVPLLALYVFADGVQNAFTGTIKGMGRQAITMPVVVFSYWFCGLPIAYYLAFIRNEGSMDCEYSFGCGDFGLVSGMTIGTWVHMILLGCVVFCAIDWQQESQRAQDRLRKDKVDG